MITFTVFRFTNPSFKSHALAFVRNKKYIPVYDSVVKYRKQFKQLGVKKRPTHLGSPSSTPEDSSVAVDSGLEGAGVADALRGTLDSVQRDLERKYVSNVLSFNHVLPTTLGNVYKLFHHLAGGGTPETVDSKNAGATNQPRAKDRVVHLTLFLDLDVRRVSFRGNLLLPHPVSASKKILVVCGKEEEQAALKSGATYAGLSYLERIENGWLDFDLLITTNLFMPSLIKLARILGPKKLMPNIKSGTLCNNLISTVKTLSSNNSVQYRAEVVTAAEFELLESVNRLKGGGSGTMRDKKQGELSKIVIPVSVLANTKEQLESNMQFFTSYLATTEINVGKKQADTNFVYPPSRGNALFEGGNKYVDTTSKGDNLVLASALALDGLQGQLFFLVGPK